LGETRVRDTSQTSGGRRYKGAGVVLAGSVEAALACQHDER
jgi:hypothetical protein